MEKIAKKTIELLAVWFYQYAVCFTTTITVYVLIYLLFTRFYWITLAYLVWLFFFKSNFEEEVRFFSYYSSKFFQFNKSFILTKQRVARLIQHFANGMFGRSIATTFRVALSKQAIWMRRETTCFAFIHTASLSMEH